MQPAGTSLGINRYSNTRQTLDDDNHSVEERLTFYLDANSRAHAERMMFRSDAERLEAASMLRPITSEQAFSLFGLLIGSLPPLAIAVKIALESVSIRPSHLLFIGVFLTASVGTGFIGTVLGRQVPSSILWLRNLRLANRIAGIVILGVVWGALSGAAGGLVLSFIGAFFGSIAGGLIGAMAVPPFTWLFELLRRGNAIEVKHFLPIALGITLSVCAFVLGL